MIFFSTRSSKNKKPRTMSISCGFHEVPREFDKCKTLRVQWLQREPGVTTKELAKHGDSCKEMPHSKVLLIFRASHLETLTAHSIYAGPLQTVQRAEFGARFWPRRPFWPGHFGVESLDVVRSIALLLRMGILLLLFSI